MTFKVALIKSDLGYTVATKSEKSVFKFRGAKHQEVVSFETEHRAIANSIRRRMITHLGKIARETFWYGTAWFIDYRNVASIKLNDMRLTNAFNETVDIVTFNYQTKIKVSEVDVLKQELADLQALYNEQKQEIEQLRRQLKSVSK